MLCHRGHLEVHVVYASVVKLRVIAEADEMNRADFERDDGGGARKSRDGEGVSRDVG
jgi:hypothetical protein